MVQRAGQGKRIASGEAELTVWGSQWAPWAQGRDGCPVPSGTNDKHHHDSVRAMVSGRAEKGGLSCA